MVASQVRDGGGEGCLFEVIYFPYIVVVGPVSEMTRSLNNEVLLICAQTLFAPVSSFDAVRAVGRLILTTD